MSDHHEKDSERAAQTTDITPDQVAQQRAFNGDAVPPQGDPDTDPEARMTTDPEPGAA